MCLSAGKFTSGKTKARILADLTAEVISLKSTDLTQDQELMSSAL